MRGVLIIYWILLASKCIYSQKDTTPSVYINADIKSPLISVPVATDYYNYVIFDNYYKGRFITDISLESYYRFRSGLLTGVRIQYYPNTIFGKKLNNFLLIGFSKKLFHSKFSISIRTGITYRSLTYLEHHTLGTYTYFDTDVNDTIYYSGGYYITHPIKTGDIYYKYVKNWYVDLQITYIISKNVGIYLVGSLLREYGYSTSYIPRTGPGTGYGFSYLLYIKSIGIGVTYKIK